MRTVTHELLDGRTVELEYPETDEEVEELKRKILSGESDETVPRRLDAD